MRTGRGVVGDEGSCVFATNSVEVIIFLPTDQNRIPHLFFRGLGTVVLWFFSLLVRM